MDSGRYKRYMVLRLFKDLLPQFEEQQSRVDNEDAYFAGWLVAISSTLLAIAVANPNQAKIVMGESYTTVALLLSVTITGGVVNRIARLWLAKWGLRFAAGRFAILAVAEELDQVMTNPESFKSSEDLTDEEVVDIFQQKTGANFYESRFDSEETKKKFIDLLRQMNETQQLAENFLAELLTQLFLAHFGFRKKVGTAILEAPQGDGKLATTIADVKGSIKKTKRKAILLRVAVAINHGIFTASALAFIVAMGLITSGLMSS